MRIKDKICGEESLPPLSFSQGMHYILEGATVDFGGTSTAVIGYVPFAKFKLVGLGLYCVEATTDGEDLDIDLGNASDADAYLAATAVTFGTGKNCAANEWLVIDDQTNILGADNVTDTKTVTVNEGTSGFGVDTTLSGAAKITIVNGGSALTTGQFVPILVVLPVE